MKLKRVKQTETKSYQGKTHDLEVGGETGSHSYVVRPPDSAQDGLVVHNSVCTTRVKTGVGYPQLSAVIECADAAHGLDGHIIADGGCTAPGDVAKAFAGGSDFVMLGGMLAGHEESGGETIVRDGEMFKAFYGMSSEKANNEYAGGMSTYKSSEGREVLVPFRGPVLATVQDILGGLRSTCTYVGAGQLKHLSKRTTFIRVANTHNRIFEK